MIVDRYDPINLFELVPKLNFEMEPELAELDRLLDDDAIFRKVKADLSAAGIPTRGGLDATPRRLR
jgi:transposase, IS5 family